MTDNTPLSGLLVNGVSAHYQQVSFHYDLEVNRGECLGIVGPSGGGKSTLLALIAGFLPLDSGDIRIDGCSIGSLKAVDRPVTEVFQANNLFSHLSLRQNVGLGLHPDLRLTTSQWQQVDSVLSSVGLEGMGTRLPDTLSGGQQSRAALARALLRDHPVLLLDEPLAALGPAQRMEMLGLIDDMTQSRKLCTLLVSHQPDELKEICSRIAFVAEGKIIWLGTVAELDTDDSPAAVRDYLGKPGSK